MYFSFFPTTTFADDSITNIMTRVIPVVRLITDGAFFQQYVVKDGERPEDVAYKFYNNPNLHIILLMINNVVDPYKDWALSGDELIQFTSQKYGPANIYATHHYIAPKGDPLAGEIVNATYNNAQSISNYAYEIASNENKRLIKVVLPAYMKQIISDLKTVL